jgi:hypothetical protein
MLGGSEFRRLKVAAPNLWEASPSSFDRPLPGEPPTRLPLPFSKSHILVTTQFPLAHLSTKPVLKNANKGFLPRDDFTYLTRSLHARFS